MFILKFIGYCILAFVSIVLFYVFGSIAIVLSYLAVPFALFFFVCVGIYLYLKERDDRT